MIRSYRVVALGNGFYFSCHAAIVHPILTARIVKIWTLRDQSTSGT